MKNLGRVVLAAALLVLSASVAWSAVTISWVDALGSHTQNLQNVANPQYDPSNPMTLEDPYVWFGALNIEMSQAPIQFNVTGNFIGEWGELWAQVRIEQHVKNLTPYPWDKFWIEIVEEDGEVYTKAMLEQNWSLTTNLLYAEFTSDGAQYDIQPGEVFDDTMHFWAMVPNPMTGDGTLTFTKRPGYVIPEVGSLAVLLTGSAGLFAQIIRKRRV